MSLPSPFRIESPAPRRPVPRAAVKIRGAFSCTTSGYVSDHHADQFKRVFNVTSYDLIGPRAHPEWRIQLQGPESGRHEGPPEHMLLIGRPDPFGPEVTYSSAKDRPGWRAEVSADRRSLDIQATMGGGGTVKDLEVHVRVMWPAPRAVVPVPAKIVDLVGECTGHEPRAFSTWEFGRAKDPECASALMPDNFGDPLACLLRGLPKGWIAFLGSTHRADESDQETIEMVAAPGHGWADALRTARTDAVNYGFGTEAVIRWLAEYHQAFGFQVLRSETDFVDLVLDEEPEDPELVALDIARLCPAYLEHQDLGGITELLGEKRIKLWWD